MPLLVGETADEDAVGGVGDPLGVLREPKEELLSDAESLDDENDERDMASDMEMENTSGSFVESRQIDDKNYAQRMLQCVTNEQLQLQLQLQSPIKPINGNIEGQQQQRQQSKEIAGDVSAIAGEATTITTIITMPNAIPLTDQQSSKNGADFESEAGQATGNIDKKLKHNDESIASSKAKIIGKLENFCHLLVVVVFKFICIFYAQAIQNETRIRIKKQKVEGQMRSSPMDIRYALR